MVELDADLDHIVPSVLPPFWAKLVVGFVSLLCFARSYDGDFVFDDSEAIVNNKDLQSDTPLGDLWHHDFWGSKLSSNTSHKSYRPLTVLTFRLLVLLAVQTSCVPCSSCCLSLATVKHLKKQVTRREHILPPSGYC